MLHLCASSDPSWVECALRDLDATLVDHAHCELKAAANALSMAARHPDDPFVVRTLTDVAREEIEHFQQVHARLEARGLTLGNPPADPYVIALRRAQTKLGPSPVVKAAAAGVDRLLTCALIEARSCERFDLLSRALLERSSREERDLGVFYSELRVSEARHYRVFVDLAIRTAGGEQVAVFARLESLARAEGAIVEAGAEDEPLAAIHG